VVGRISLIESRAGRRIEGGCCQSWLSNRKSMGWWKRIRNKGVDWLRGLCDRYDNPSLSLSLLTWCRAGHTWHTFAKCALDTDTMYMLALEVADGFRGTSLA